MTEEILRQIRVTCNRLDSLLLQAYEEAETGEKEIVRDRIKELLNRLSIKQPTSSMYLEEMVAICYAGPIELLSIPKVYQMVAKKKQTTTNAVKYAIRYAIKVAYHSGNQKMLQKVIGTNSTKEAILSNELFVTAIVNYLKQEA